MGGVAVADHAGAAGPSRARPGGVAPSRAPSSPWVIAESELEARELAIEVFHQAVRTAKMPEWPIVEVETISEREAFELEDQ